MDEQEALKEMNRIAEYMGYQITQRPVYGPYSSRTVGGVRVRDITRTYEKEGGDKLTVAYYATSDEIRY